MPETVVRKKFLLDHISTNPNVAYLHTRKFVGEGTLVKFDHNGTEGNLPELMQLLSSVDGVNFGMLTERYTVLITKSAVYDWQEIEQEIAKIIDAWDN